MSKFECKNCGFVMEQETQPESCPICGGHDFTVSGSTQANPQVNVQVNADTVKNEPVREASPAPAVPRNSYAQFREFPAVQRDRVKKDLEEKVNAIQDDMAAFEGQMEAERKKQVDKDAGMFASINAIVFLIGLTATCGGSCLVCVSNDGFTSGFGSVIQTLFAGLFLTVVASFVITMIVGKIASPKKKGQQNIDVKRSTAEEEKKSIQEAARKSISEYSESFDRAVKETVQRFVSNKTTEEIGNRILGSFLDAIEGAPRDAVHKDVLVSCQYSVYANQVQYGGGIFSFSQNHCSNLAGPVEQAALGQAIAAYLEIHVLEKYDRDPCGSVPQIVIGTEDKAVSRTVTVTYKAANVNYRGV